MRSRASTAARHVPAIAPIVLRRTMRTFPPLPVARTVFGDPLPSPPPTSVASAGDVHPDHSYALIALGAGASVPPAPPMPRAPLWRSVAQAPLALRNRRAFIGPRTRSWYLYRGLYHPQVKPTYTPPRSVRGLERPSKWRSYLLARRPELAPHVPTWVRRMDLPSVAPLDGPFRIVKVWARPIAGVAHFNRLVQRVLLHHGAEWAEKFRVDPLLAWEEYRAAQLAAQQAAATPPSLARPTSVRQVKKRAQIPTPLSQCRQEFAPVEEVCGRRKFSSPRSHFLPSRLRPIVQERRSASLPARRAQKPLRPCSGFDKMPTPPPCEELDWVDLTRRWKRLRGQKAVYFSPHVQVCPILEWQTNPAPAESGLARDVGSVEVDEASQAAIVSTPPETQAVAVAPGLDPSVLSESVSSLPSERTSDSDKWIALDNITWDTSGSMGEKLFNADFPYCLLQRVPTHPAMLPFTKSFQWRGSLRFKLLLTSGVYQQGELLVAFLHELTTRRNSDRFLHTHSLSQVPHTIITAGGTRSVEVVVPYVNSRPYLPIVGSDRSPPLNLGRLVVMVFNSLVCADTTQKFATVQIYVKLENSEFCGTRPLSPLTPGAGWEKDIAQNSTPIIQFQGLLGDIISGGLRGAIRAGTNWLNADANRDYPSALAPPQPCLTLQTESLAIGQGISTARSLRLIPDVMTPHLSNEDELMISHVARQFGRVSVVTWPSSSPVGTTLWLKPAAYLWPLDSYDKIAVASTKTTDLYFVPPMGIVASCFQLARGSIEIKVRAVATSLHGGKLILGYIPYRASVPADVSTTDLLASSYVTWDISESSEITYSAPYVKNELWTPQVYTGTGGSGNYYEPEGVLAINVLTPLMYSSDTVAKDISLNIFVRAGVDFEVAVPRVPTLIDLSSLVFQGDESDVGLMVETTQPASTSIAKLTHGEVVKDFKDVFRRFSLLTKFTISATKDSTTISVPCSYTIPLHFLGMLSDGTAGSWVENKVLNSVMKLISSAYRYRLGGMRLKLVFNNVKARSSVYVQHVPTTLNKYKTVTDTGGKLDATTSYTNYLSTSYGTVFQTLSDNNVVEVEVPCYNTNVYCLQALHPNARQQEALNSDLGALRLFFPNRDLVAGATVHVYYAWADDTRVYHFQGYPAVASMASEWGVKPDSNTSSNRVSRHLASVEDTESDTSDIEEAEHLEPPTIHATPFTSSVVKKDQATRPVEEVWVPIVTRATILAASLQKYEFTPEIQAQIAKVMENVRMHGIPPKPVVRTNTARHYELNSELITIFGKELLEALHAIMVREQRSPYGNVMDLTLYNHQALEAELKGPKYFHYTIREWIALKTRIQPERLAYLSTELEWQVLTSALDIGLKSAAAVAGAAGTWALTSKIPNTPANQASEVSAKLDNVSQQLQQLTARVDQEFSQFSELLKYVKTYLPTSAGEFAWERIAFSFIQLLNSSTGTMFGMNFAAFLLDLGMFDSRSTLWATSTLAVVLGQAYDAYMSTQHLTDSKPNELQYQNDSAIKSALYVLDTAHSHLIVKSFVEMVVSILKFNKFKLPDIPYAKLVAGLYTAGKMSRDISSIQRLIQDNLELLLRCWRWVTAKVYKCVGLRWAVRDLRADMKNWVTEAYYLTEPGVCEKAPTDPVLAYRVHVASLNAQRLVSSGVGTGLGVSPLVLKLLTQLRELKAKVDQNTQVPPVRMEPFVIQMYGKTSCGKSSVADKIIIHLLRKLYGSNLVDNHTYTREPMCEFWDGCFPTSCKAIKTDDFLAVTGDGLGTKQIATLFSLKSCAVFMPPFAHLDQKGQRLNPDLYLIMSNVAYPKLAGVTSTPAVWRRRDALIEQQFECEYSTIGAYVQQLKISEPDLTNTEVWERVNTKLRFRFMDPLQEETTGTQVWLSLTEMLAELTERFTSFRRQEEVAFTHRLNIAYNIDEGLFTENFPVDQPFDPDVLRDYRTVLEHQASKLGNTAAAQRARDKLMKLKRIVDLGKPEFLASAVLALETPGSMLAQANPTDDDLLSCVTGGAHQFNIPSPVMSPPTSYISPGLTPPSDGSNIQPSVPQLTTSEAEDLISLACDDATPVLRHQTDDLAATEARVAEIDAELHQAARNDLSRWGTGQPLPQYRARLDGVELEGCFHHKLNPSATYSDGWFCLCVTDQYKLLQVSECRCVGQCFWDDLKEYTKLMFAWRDRPENARAMRPGADERGVPMAFRKQQQQVTPNHRATAFVDMLESSAATSVASEVPRRVFTVGKILAGTFALISAVTCGTIAWKFLKGFMRPSSQSPSHVPAIVADTPEGVMSLVSRAAANDYVVSLLPQAIVASGDAVRAKKLTTRARKLRRVERVATLKPESVSALNNVETRIGKNTCFLSFLRDGKACLTARCLGVQGRWILTTWHFVEQAKDLFSLPLTLAYNNSVIPIVMQNFNSALRYGQLAFIQLPPSAPNFKKISHFFATEEEHLRTSAASAYLLEKREDAIMYAWTGIGAHPMVETQHVGSAAGCTSADISEGYAYNIGRAGLCGAVLLDPCIQNGKILGMHVAGAASSGEKMGRYGVSAMVVFEEVEAYLSSDAPLLTMAEPVEAIPELDLQTDPTFIVDLPAEVVGVLPSKLQPQNPIKTTIVPSDVAVYLPPPVTTPAPFTSRDERFKEPRNPFVEGVEKHGGLPISWPETLVRRAYEVMLDRFLRCKPVRKVVGKLSIEEAVVGVQGVDEIGSIDMTTSPGFGWKHLAPPGEKGKRWLFELEETSSGNRLNSVHKELLKILQQENDMREQGCAPATVFTDCLKDARIKVEKVQKKGCTRIFSLSPVQHTIACRQYTVEFVAAVMRYRITNNVCVGINMDSLEATRLVKKHMKVSDRHLCGDYSAFGDTLDPQLVYYCFKIIAEWYKYYGDQSRAHELARMALGIETGQALHAARDLVYRVFSGLPSGSPLTVIINSMVNSFYTLLSFEEITGLPLETYSEYVAEDNYGDDLWLTVKDDIIDKFNNVLLHENFKKHNIRYTDALKTGSMREYCSLAEVSFLKRNFVRHPTRDALYLAPLDWVSVEECAKWIHFCDNTPEATAVNILAAQRLAFGHGPTKFKEFTELLKVAARQAEVRVCGFLDWHALDAQIFEG